MGMTRRRFIGVTAVVGTTAATAAALPWRRQIASYLTHWKGAPDHAVPYVATGEPALLHLGAAGDIGDSGSRLDATAAAMATLAATDPYRALLLLGDNVYPDGDPARIPETVLDPFASVLGDGTELLAILGNHDVKSGNGPGQLAALGMEGPSWSRSYPDTLVVGLDSNDVDDPAQLAFLDETLAGSTVRWKIVAVHHPPYSAGYQGSSHHVRDVLCPIFERHQVDVVLSGHDHDYQRSVPVNGVVYIVSGAGSGTRRTGEESFTAVSWSWHHFLDIEVFPDRFQLRAVNQSGEVADELVLPTVRP